MEVYSAFSVLGSMVSLIAYIFYIFGGIALGYSVLQFKRGNLDAMIKGFMGAGLLCTAPTLLEAIISTL